MKFDDYRVVWEFPSNLYQLVSEPEPGCQLRLRFPLQLTQCCTHQMQLPSSILPSTNYHCPPETTQNPSHARSQAWNPKISKWILEPSIITKIDLNQKNKSDPSINCRKLTLDSHLNPNLQKMQTRTLDPKSSLQIPKCAQEDIYLLLFTLIRPKATTGLLEITSNSNPIVPFVVA